MSKPTIPDEPDLPYRLYFPDIEHHATAVGYICFTYAILESTADQFIRWTLDCNDDATRVVLDAAGKFENRCTLLIKLIYATCPDKAWDSAVEEFVNSRIKNDIMRRRHRFVHDEWILGETPKQWISQVKLGKAHAGAYKSILPKEEKSRELEELWRLVRDIQEATVILSQCSSFYALWRQRKRPLSLPPQLSPDDKGTAQ